MMSKSKLTKKMLFEPLDIVFSFRVFFKNQNAELELSNSASDIYGGQAKVVHATNLESVRMLVTSFVGSTTGDHRIFTQQKLCERFFYFSSLLCEMQCSSGNYDLFRNNGELK